MSGGVDSSTSVALLQNEGYEVVGAFIKTWSPDWLPCSWAEERRDAMRVAAHLNIPLITVDLEKEYKEGVADYMIAEYRAGRTPNPDVMCNKEVKFGVFLEKARELGFDYIATGHYCQTDGENLLRGADSSKDQSYFLWTLSKDQLAQVLFPVGQYEKSKVRELAEQFELPVSDKKDSQGVCFLGEINMKEFLGHYIETKEGNVLDEAGGTIGSHDGALLYTIGERHGFTISKSGPDKVPHYIVARDLDKNTLTVSGSKPDSVSGSAKNEYQLKDINWISGNEISEVAAAIRYHGKEYKATVSGETITFDEPVAVAAGQSVVFYAGDKCLGGGVVA